ncbi:hypothetical protein HUE87_05720 [Candidatus Sulfurimonas marisnigri]|uniref:Uncharacterized protein n=1 Tax=Candidatus Sulfurimonas marisnigri TaxID=2740405 RepID=A0A7S7RRI7_9BACT|nr:hypothetical protein [Candidatus Sulfurimonas marisnigri]QOY55723.1 hypothetical protein HUE87_05720 [Candidatus Sulfurimonas marisnigri]
MNKKIEKILEIWHKHFESEDRQYSEFEDSDIEYFVGCLLYNHFSLSKSLDTMKTIDLSYDFISECGDEYDEVMSIIKSIDFDDETQKLEFLQNYLTQVKSKYSGDELYLLNRLEYHVNGIAQRYKNDEESETVVFDAPVSKSRNPLLR